MNIHGTNPSQGAPLSAMSLDHAQREPIPRWVDQVASGEIKMSAPDRRALFEHMLGFDPNHLPSLLGLGSALLELDQHAPAADVFERALQQHPGHLALIDGLSQALGREQGERQIMQRLEALLSEQPDAASLIALASQMCEKLSLLNADEAPDWEDSDAFSEILYRAAQRSVEANDPASALRVHEFALGVGEFVPRSGLFVTAPNHAIGRAMMLLRLDRFDEASDVFFQFAVDYPFDPEGPNGLIAVCTSLIGLDLTLQAEWLLADVLEMLGEFDETERAGVNLIEMGNGFLSLGRADDALHAAQLVPHLRQNPHALALAGRAFSMLGRREAAVEVFAIAANLFFARGDWRDAKSAAEEALKDKPQPAGMLKIAGEASGQLGDWETAFRYLSPLVERTPENAGNHCLLATAQHRLGWHHDALKSYEAALALNGLNVDALFGAAECLISLASRLGLVDQSPTSEQKKSGFSAALRYLRRALALRPYDPKIKLKAATAQDYLGKPAAALRGYQEVLAQWPQSLEALRGKARAELALGRLAEALNTAASLPDKDRDRDDILIHGVTHIARQGAQGQ